MILNKNEYIGNDGKVKRRLTPEQVRKKVINILNNNKGYQEAVESYKDTALRLTHWGQPETPEQLVFIWPDGTVVLSNEGLVPLTGEVYTTVFMYGLEEDFQKAGLFVEPYDGGTFHVYDER